jgi:hypothetical protein
MNTPRMWFLRVAVFVLVALVAIGASETLRGKVSPGLAQAVLHDHLYCYSVQPVHDHNVGVSVLDQFHPNREAVHVRNVKFLCTPADKDPDGGPPGPTNQVHYLCYGVQPQHTHSRDVRVVDQFHPSGETLKVTYNRHLCVPTIKTPAD